MIMICLGCYNKFPFYLEPFRDYPYCPECGSGRTGYYDEDGKLVMNN